MYIFETFFDLLIKEHRSKWYNLNGLLIINLKTNL